MSGGMKLSTIEFVRLLPHFMRDDLAVQGLASGIDSLIPSLAESIGRLTSWDKIEELSEAELDELAWELNIFWYNKSAPIETKRDLVRNSDKVYQKLGTKWAVENVIEAYFGEGYLQEWYEYGGDPGTFRVYSSNPTLNNERINEFLSILSKVKRHSAHLDGVFITLSGEMKLCAGVGISEISKETYSIGVKPI